MKTPHKILLIVVAAGIGLGLGFALRGKSRFTVTSSTGEPGSPTVSETKSSPSSNLSGRVQAGADLSSTTRWERDFSMSSGVTRWLYWFEVMEKAAPEDLPRLLRLAQGNDAATRLVTERWIELYPRHVLDTIVAAVKEGRGSSVRNLSDQLFNQWSRRDPEAAIAALKSLDNFAMRDSWRRTVAGAVIEKDPELGLRTFSEWQILNFGPRMNALNRWASADPRHAAEFTLENPAGFASERTMETIGKEWAKTDPAAAMQFATSKPGKLAESLATATMLAWAAQDLNKAAAWLATADAHTRDSFSKPLVEAWAKSDAGAALAWCEANLAGSSLAQAVGGVVKGVAEKDLAAARALVNSLNPSPGRAEAAAAVARQFFPSLITTAPMKPENLAWLATLDADSAGRVVDEVCWTWSTADPKSMATFLASSPERFSGTAYSTLARELARKNPLEALDWAAQLPGDRSRIAGGDAFSEWRRHQPDVAMKWLNQLPPDDTRRQPFFENAVRDLAWDGSAAQFAALTPSERTVARKVIEGMTLPADRRASLLETLNGL